MDENPVKRGDVLEVYADGASRGNPGPSAWAYLLVKNGQTIYCEKDYLGDKTNNVAEYAAIIEALKKAESYTRWELHVYSDSILVINQINKEWRIKKKHLSKLCDEVYSLRQKFQEVKFRHTSRGNKFIKKADNLCNDCLNEHTKDGEI